MAGFIQVGSVVYAANGLNKEVRLNELDPENEIRSLRIQIEMTLISTAGGFNIVAGDHFTLVNNILARVKGSWNFDDNALNLVPWQLRVLTQDSQAADSWTEDLRVGDAIPAVGAPPAIAKKIPVDINFTHVGADTPNLACMTTDQFNASAAKLMLDLGALATVGGPVVLGGGTATVVVTDIKVMAEYGDAYGICVGPHWTMQEKGEGKNTDADLSPGIEWFLAQESLPATFETIFSQLLMDVDGRTRVRSVTPTAIAQDYLRTSARRDSLRSFDITRHALGGGGNSTGQVTPIRWVRSHIRSAEYELPFHNVHRKLEFTRVAGAAAAYLFIQTKTAHVEKIENVGRRLMGAAGVGGKFKDLRPRGFGGAENDAFSQFKGRIIKLREAA